MNESQSKTRLDMKCPILDGPFTGMEEGETAVIRRTVGCSMQRAAPPALRHRLKPSVLRPRPASSCVSSFVCGTRGCSQVRARTRGVVQCPVLHVLSWCPVLSVLSVLRPSCNILWCTTRCRLDGGRVIGRAGVSRYQR